LIRRILEEASSGSLRARGAVQRGGVATEGVSECSASGIGLSPSVSKARVRPLRLGARAWRSLAALVAALVLSLLAVAPAGASAARPGEAPAGAAPAGAAPARDSVAAGAAAERAGTPLDAPPHTGTPLRDGPVLPRDAVEPGTVTEIPAPPEGFNTYDGGWMRIAFPPSKRHRIQPLIHDADAFRDQLRELFGYPVLNHVSVHVGRTPGEMATLAPPDSPFPKYAEGVAYPGLGLILLTIDPKYPNSEHDLGEVFRHELAHLALHEALEGRHVPQWLNEGFAIHLSGESSLLRMQTLFTATLSETVIPLLQLDPRFPDDIVETPIAYAQSADVVRYLLRTRYNQRFIAMLRRVRSGQPFASAMADAYGFEVYGVGENSLEDEWRRDLAKRYSFWPVLFSGSMVWIGALGLFVVGYFRKRKQQRVTLDRWAVEEASENRQQLGVATQAPTSRMHIVLAPKEGSVAAEAVVPEFKKPTRDVDVPKVEHEGSWHTLH